MREDKESRKTRRKRCRGSIKEEEEEEKAERKRNWKTKRKNFSHKVITGKQGNKKKSRNY